MCLPLAILGPILGGIAAGGASAIGQAVGSANAAGAQERNANQAMDLQREMYGQQRADMWDMYNQQRQDMSPWLGAGQSSLGELLRQMGAGEFDQPFDYSQLANDPGFQFRMEQGQKALERSASARGLLNSGGALKSLTRYSQGLASDEFQNAWSRNQAENTGRYNRLANMAGVGQAAAQNLGAMGGQTAGNLGQFGGQFASNMGNLYGALGNAQSAGAMGGANAFSGMMNTLGNAGTLAGMMNMWGQGGNIPTQSTVRADGSYGMDAPGAWNPFPTFGGR